MDSALDSKPKRKGNPNWVKGVSGNPSGKPKGLSEWRAELERKVGHKVIEAVKRCIDSQDERVVMEAAKFAASYMWGKPIEADVLAHIDAALARRGLAASSVTVEALPDKVAAPEPIAPSGAPPEPTAHTAAVEAPAFSRCMYRLASGQCETAALDGSQWCQSHKDKLFSMLGKT